MGLRLKFNLVLALVFAIGLAASGHISYNLLHENARAEVLRNAGVMMEAALSMRSYTVEKVRPALRVSEDEFLPQGVPAFGATQIMTLLRKKYPDYFYKEATLNPTNLADRAVEWETDVVNAFRNNEGLKEVTGTRDTPSGPALYLARPLTIRDGACLVCHSVPAAAPPAMVKAYGPSNGFGWKLNETIGAQIVSVPMALPIANANRAFYTFMGSLAAVFVVLFVSLNVMLSMMIVRPIRAMAEAADRISVGDTDITDLKASGRDEVSVLAQSINRMRRSLEKAIKLISEG
jgi:protein-histidine pros-kinase